MIHLKIPYIYLKSMDSEHFTNILAGFNMYKLIHKPTRFF